MKSTFSYFKSTLIFLIFCPFYAHTHQDTRKDTVKQQIRNQLTDIPEFFFRPLEYTDPSFKFFFIHIYNHRRYPQSFLALNFIHVLSGLSLAPRAKEPRRYIRGLLYLFDRKLQGIYVNPYALFELVTNMPAVIAPYCNASKEKNDRIEEIKECVGTYLADHFQSFQTHPDKALTELATRLYTLHNVRDEKDITIVELQSAIHYFLSRALSHVVWTPADQADTWDMLKKTATILEKFTECNMLDDEMLDDLYWVVLQRYAFFVDLCATDFMQPFFDTVYHDLRTEKAELWCAPERELNITTKREYLQSVLMEAEIKSRASGAALVIDGQQ